MSLSKTIIYGQEQEVASALAYATNLNELDEYGYTPLIQACVVNSAAKAQLLLQAGADVDFQDLTGRTALHWSASNNNSELCKLLLQNRANPNAYTYAAQPALAMPLLAKNKRIKRLLIDKGADLEFAQDFINTKLLGHRFALEGRSDIVDTQNTFIEIELEGFYLEFSIEIVINSLKDFQRNFAGKNLRPYFPYLNLIIKSMQIASELIKYQHYLIDQKKYTKRIDRFLESNPLVLPISFEGHAISFIKFHDFLIRCDRGEFGRKNGSVIFYEMQNPAVLTKSICKELLYKRQYRGFINHALVKHLQLEPKFIFPLSLQKTGNCAWANVEAIMPTLLFLFLLEERGMAEVDACIKEALHVYETWVDWDKNRALHFCLESFKESSPARKASKAALLAAILFQACDYVNDLDQIKARKILPILALPEYAYILQAYEKVFAKDRNNRNLKNLHDFLDNYR